MKKLHITSLALQLILLLSTIEVLHAQSLSNSSELSTAPWINYPYIQFSSYPQLEGTISAEAYLLLDMNSGYILSSSNLSLKHGIASLTKLMTCYIVLQDLENKRYSLEDRFIVPDTQIFSTLPFDASRMGLLAGQNPSVEELLMGLLVLSGNDAAIFLATISRGSEHEFVKEMNRQARILSLDQTNFADSSGLSPLNISTVNDMAILSYFLLNNSNFEINRFTSIPEMTWNNYTKANTNLLLKNYEGVDGLKTGYTSEAGYNFIASAYRKIFSSNFQRRILVVIFGAEAETHREGLLNRAEFARILLDYAYDNFDYMRIAFNAKSIRVYGGVENETLLYSPEEYALLPNKWQAYIQSVIDVPKYLWAPIDTHTVYGNIVFEYINADERAVISDMNIKSKDSVERSNVIKRLLDYIKMQFIKYKNDK